MYTSEPIDYEIAEIFMQDLPSLSSDDSSSLEMAFSKAEFETSLKQLKDNPSPGPAGLTKAFYVKFIDLCCARLFGFDYLRLQWLDYLLMVGISLYGILRSGRMISRSRLSELGCSSRDMFEELSGILHEGDICDIGKVDSNTYNVEEASREAADLLNMYGQMKVTDKSHKIISISKQVFEFRVHWLPSYVKDTFLEEFFSKFGKAVLLFFPGGGCVFTYRY